MRITLPPEVRVRRFVGMGTSLPDRFEHSDPRFAALDAAAFASKNLYNVALYTTRQAYIFRGEIITYPRLAKELRTTRPTERFPQK